MHVLLRYRYEVQATSQAQLSDASDLSQRHFRLGVCSIKQLCAAVVVTASSYLRDQSLSIDLQHGILPRTGGSCTWLPNPGNDGDAL